VSPKARRRAAAVALVALIAGGALAFGQFSGTFAIFTAETENPNSAALGSWIPPPTPGGATLNNSSPYATEHLPWTSGFSTVMPGAAPNPVSGQTIYYADGGTGASASCPAAGNVAYTSFATVANNITTDDVTGTNLTHWWCWEVQSTSTSATTSGSWTSDPKLFAAGLRLFVLTAFDEHNVATANSLRNTDQIILTFNQNRGAIGGGAGNGNVDVRVCNTGKILVSTAATANCNATPNIGTITGQTVGTSTTCNTSTTAGNGTTTLTITLGGCGSNSAIGAGTATFTPTGTGLVATAGTNLCSSGAAPNCTATTTDRF
jgi:hypothetical protein